MEYLSNEQEEKLHYFWPRGGVLDLVYKESLWLGELLTMHRKPPEAVVALRAPGCHLAHVLTVL